MDKNRVNTFGVLGSDDVEEEEVQVRSTPGAFGQQTKGSHDEGKGKTHGNKGVSAQPHPKDRQSGQAYQSHTKKAGHGAFNEGDLAGDRTKEYLERPGKPAGEGVKETKPQEPPKKTYAEYIQTVGKVEDTTQTAGQIDLALKKKGGKIDDHAEVKKHTGGQSYKVGFNTAHAELLGFNEERPRGGDAERREENHGAGGRGGFRGGRGGRGGFIRRDNEEHQGEEGGEQQHRQRGGRGGRGGRGRGRGGFGGPREHHEGEEREEVAGEGAGEGEHRPRGGRGRGRGYRGHPRGEHHEGGEHEQHQEGEQGEFRPRGGRGRGGRGRGGYQARDGEDDRQEGQGEFRPRSGRGGYQAREGEGDRQEGQGEFRPRGGRGRGGYQAREGDGDRQEGQGEFRPRGGRGGRGGFVPRDHEGGHEGGHRPRGGRGGRGGQQAFTASETDFPSL